MKRSDKPVCGAVRKVHYDRGETDEGAPYYCSKPAGYGTAHRGYGNCKYHLGNAKNQVISAERQMQAELVETLGLPREVDPQSALLEEIHRTAGVVDYLAYRVSLLTEDELTQTAVERGDGALYERPAAVVELYQTERKHLADVCTKAIRAGIAERQVRIIEQQGELVARAIRAILDDLGVGNHPKANEVVGRHLRAISA